MMGRLNFTGRRPIRPEDVKIHITEADGAVRFDAELDLGRYNLPAHARVFVEAYRQTMWQRFDFGTVGAPCKPDDRVLRDVRSPDGVKFRVKVVENAPAGASVRPAKILALADQIRPRNLKSRTAQSLLPVDTGDSKDQIWWVEFGDDEPLLRISSTLVSDWRGFVTTPEFVTLALPEIFRSILTRILLIEEHVDRDDAQDWRNRWLRFARESLGMPEPPAADRKDISEQEQWIDDAVEAFCRRKDIGARLGHWRKEEE